MEEIKVGEYGRTNKGKIFIFAWLENSDEKRYTNKVLLGNGKIFENKFYYFDDGEEIVKHSKNIIDLIEVGDFINGMKIDDIGEIKRFGKTAQKCLWVNIGDGIDIIDEEIKDILTKEQHMQNCYKIAEENSSIN